MFAWSGSDWSEIACVIQAGPLTVTPSGRGKSVTVSKCHSNGLTRDFGTQDQCRSQKFQKTVRYLSKICQKTVSYKNQSENSKKCVRYKSENCQLQISVRTLLEKIYKCIRNVSVFINVSENCHWLIQKTVRTLSEISLLTDF